MSKTYFLQKKKEEEKKKAQELPALKSTKTNTVQKSSYVPKNLALKQDARRTYRENVNKEREIEQKDSKVIREYESIPEYNILERLTDDNKKQAYERKNSLAGEYQTAKANQLSKKLSDSGINRGTLDLVFGGVEAQNEKELPALRQQALEAEKRLQDTGVDMQQLEQYYIKNMLAPETKQAFAERAKENPVSESLFSIPVKSVGGIAGFVGDMYNQAMGIPILESNLHKPTELVNTTRNTITEGIDSQLGKDAYNLAMSMGDSTYNAVLGNALLGGLGQGVGNTIGGKLGQSVSNVIDGTFSFGNAYSSEMVNGMERGLSQDQMIKTALASGINEMVFGAISLGNLKGILSGNKAIKNGAKNIFSQIIGQMAREGGEEMGTEVVNTIADTLINKELSNYVQSVEGYMSQGMSEEDARKQTLLDTAKNVGKAGIMGAFSGGLMGTGAAALNRVGNAFSENDSKANAEIPSLKKETENKANTRTREIPTLKKTPVKAIDVQTIPALKPTTATNVQEKSVPLPVLNIAPNTQATLNTNRIPSLKDYINAVQSDPEPLANSTRMPSLADMVPVYEQASAQPFPALAKQNANSGTSQNASVIPTLKKSNQKVRGYDNTLVEKTDMPAELKNEFINEPDLYEKLSNKETSLKAEQILANSNSLDEAIYRCRSLLEARKPESVPLAYDLAQSLIQSGRLEEAVQLERDMAKALTESGQFSQAAAIRMLGSDPMAAMTAVKRDIAALNKEGQQKFGKKWTDFSLSEAEIKAFGTITRGDTQAIQNLSNSIWSRIQKQYPATMKEKLSEFRKTAMLLHSRTNTRNFASNALMLPVRWTADRVAALGEGAYHIINPSFERTQSLNPFSNQKTRELSQQAWDKVKDSLLQDNKYVEGKYSARDKQVFKGSFISQALDKATNGAITKINQFMGKDIQPSLMETARNFTYWLLEKGDAPFVKVNFKSRMASYIRAQGITDLDSIPEDAYILATQEALKATFKDDTALSKCIMSIRDHMGIVGEVIFPFAKTTSNIAVRGLEYSPAGVAKGIIQLSKAQNDTDVAKGITSLGQAATGTAAIAIGYFLAQLGIITGDLSEDKDKALFQKQKGMLPYSIKVGNEYYTYDWAQPASIPFMLGAVTYQSLQEHESLVKGLKNAAVATADSLLQLSPINNLTDIFNGYGTPAENLGEVMSDSFLSFIPQVVGATARATDNTQRTAFNNQDPLNSFVNSAKAKIPGLSNDLPPSYSTWGQELKRNDTGIGNVLAQFISPGQSGVDSSTNLDKYIMDVAKKTGFDTVYPRKAEWSYEKGGQTYKLTNEQYSEMQRIMGKNSYRGVSELVYSDYYKSLSENEKRRAIENIYGYALMDAKSEVLKMDYSDEKYMTIAEERGAEGVATYSAIRAVHDTITNKNDGKTTNKTRMKALDSIKGLSDSDKGYYLSNWIKLSEKEALVREEMGDEGIYTLYSFKVQLPENAKNAEAFQVIDSSDLSDAEKGYYMYAMFGSGEKAEAVKENFGDEGIYKWYYTKLTAADSNENGKNDESEHKKAIKNSNWLTSEEKNYFLNLYKR